MNNWCTTPSQSFHTVNSTYQKFSEKSFLGRLANVHYTEETRILPGVVRGRESKRETDEKESDKNDEQDENGNDEAQK